MAVLPADKAKGLGDIMAKNGLGASLAMKGPSEPSADEDADAPEDDQSELDLCIADLADAVVAGDKDSIKAAFRDLVDCIKYEDEEQDAQLGE